MQTKKVQLDFVKKIVNYDEVVRSFSLKVLGWNLYEVLGFLLNSMRVSTQASAVNDISC